MQKFNTLLYYIPYTYAKVASVLWGTWIGTVVYADTISFLNNKKKDYLTNNFYNITLNGILISGIIGGNIGLHMSKMFIMY